MKNLDTDVLLLHPFSIKIINRNTKANTSIKNGKQVTTNTTRINVNKRHKYYNECKRCLHLQRFREFKVTNIRLQEMFTYIIHNWSLQLFSQDY